jgi:CubicO group peptidase (beta-lactamase class C family)
MRSPLTLLACAALACGASEERPSRLEAPPDGGPSAADAAPALDARADAGAPAVDAGPGPDAGRDAGGADRLAPVRALLDEAVASGELLGFGFAVMTEAGGPGFVHAGGAYALDQPLPLDSCSKPVTALTILRLVESGRLALEDTLGERLGWTGPEAQVTIRQLMAFISGFSGNARCLSPPAFLRRDGRLLQRPNRSTLAECAEDIRRAGLVDPPGTTFRYGGTHQSLLAHVAETVTGTPWSALFDAEVGTPLGLGSDFFYATNRVAGSGVSTAPTVVRIFWRIGADAGLLSSASEDARLLSRPLARRFLQSQTSDPVNRADSPWAAAGLDLRFGLGIWIDCLEPGDCLHLGSGANGSTAWIDPAGGYAAALVAYQRDFTGYRTTHAVMRRLVPELRRALAR